VILNRDLLLCLSLPALPAAVPAAMHPELAALSRFPPAEVVKVELVFARQASESLQMLALAEAGGVGQAVTGRRLVFVLHCVDVWEDLSYAQSNRGLADCLDWLDSLRAKLGEAAWAAGQMPYAIECFDRGP
jgi:hypothetical protein